MEKQSSSGLCINPQIGLKRKWLDCEEEEEEEYDGSDTVSIETQASEKFTRNASINTSKRSYPLTSMQIDSSFRVYKDRDPCKAINRGKLGSFSNFVSLNLRENGEDEKEELRANSNNLLTERGLSPHQFHLGNNNLATKPKRHSKSLSRENRTFIENDLEEEMNLQLDLCRRSDMLSEGNYNVWGTSTNMVSEGNHICKISNNIVSEDAYNISGISNIVSESGHLASLPLGLDYNGYHIGIQTGNISTTLSEGGHMSSLLLGSESCGGIQPNNINCGPLSSLLLDLGPNGGDIGLQTKNICNDSIPVVDEGSDLAQCMTAGGGYIPSLLMGRRVESTTCLDMQHHNAMHLKKSSVDTTARNGGGAVPEKAPKTCKVTGCRKGARGATGLCIIHGGGRRCEKPGCKKWAESRTVFCKSHGGGRRCQKLGCTKSSDGKTDYCIGHGGGRRCSYDGCTKAARGRSGLCIRHGGGKRCCREGCTKSAEGYSGLCISHGGGRRCEHEGGCGKGAQGSTRFCKAHGGGKRCMIEGCNKGAEGSTPLCKGHGGGKRCMFDGGGICTKSVHGGTPFCVAHGGGKRCVVSGCTKSARGRTNFCVKHGGGKRCKYDKCTKSAQGSTDFCKAHGGGKRCQWGCEGCPYSEYVKDKTGELLKGPCDRFARGRLGLCAAHSALVQDRRVHGVSTLGNALPARIKPGLFRGLVSGTTTAGASAMLPEGDQLKVKSSFCLQDCEDGKEGEQYCAQTDFKSCHYIPGLTFTGDALDMISDDGCEPSNKEVTSLGHWSGITPQPSDNNISLHWPMLPPHVLVPPFMQNGSVLDFTQQKGTSGLDDSILDMSSPSLLEERVHGGSIMALLTSEDLYP